VAEGPNSQLLGFRRGGKVATKVVHDKFLREK